MGQVDFDDYVIVKELFDTGEDKRAYVQSMFNAVAKRYDFMNSVLSVGIHHLWKRLTVAKTGIKPGQKALDICTGTADIAIRLAGKVGPSGKVTGVDFSKDMLAIGKQKVNQARLDNIDLIFGNVETLELPDEEFEAVTVGFGIRNVVRLNCAISEVLRVLKPGGRFACLEFSQPTSAVIRKLYDYYSLNIMPRMGKVLANDSMNGYFYLPKSIRLFPDQEKFKKILEEMGFVKVKYYNLTTGIAALHIGAKPN